ncbi:4-hydroxy-tetrahydrodipicolinate reductase [Litoribacter ruber]|uniref:4-hydroxy-tetrahydrodipicolinate reductase n=1 Tax=Litoribacter ruber TaxID=702568 RepID=A0AAP2CFT5_9BACT|nr:MULTISPECIES: 4-hydroxy-tetrahydrodipicolinate reductase [Litoribacter]MBS9523217.1 4-hydroxy-tetrahydrodipicolinate reductase [Litoribacter alkaliphilus]MBT0810620.1 4-hydroxy-tetrahydrodipicolinate reductase [Litoribacter ruber]
MNIIILGYGKMGKIISEIAEERGHTIVAKITSDNRAQLDNLDGSSVDVAIEFSQPESAVDNLSWAINQGIPVVCGTTGWLEHKHEVEQLTLSKGGAFFYASNFSIGVNIFFKVNRYLAKLMDEQHDYAIRMEEIHHTEKKDAPSGTAITLAEDIINKIDRAKRWNLDTESVENGHNILISAKRIDKVPGTHTVTYSSETDDIEIKHTAHSRKGFALGAVLVSEWIKNRKGILSMDDFLSF